MNEFFESNHRLVFQEWIQPEELTNTTILDLGCGTGWLGEYCKEHGASHYVGIDIDEYLINNAKKDYPDLTFFIEDAEVFVKDCIADKKFFDIVVISRTLQGIQNQITFLQDVSKITNQIVLETGVPVNFGAHKILDMLKNTVLTEEQQSQINNIVNYIEYDQPFIEYVVDDRFVQPIPSIGLFKQLANKIGFELCLKTYESVKQKYPTEYGYHFKNKEWDLIGKSILKLKRLDKTAKPISWKEWNDTLQ